MSGTMLKAIFYARFHEEKGMWICAALESISEPFLPFSLSFCSLMALPQSAFLDISLALFSSGKRR